MKSNEVNADKNCDHLTEHGIEGDLFSERTFQNRNKL
jgi:hypothetical protein